MLTSLWSMNIIIIIVSAATFVSYRIQLVVHSKIKAKISIKPRETPHTTINLSYVIVKPIINSTFLPVSPKTGKWAPPVSHFRLAHWVLLALSRAVSHFLVPLAWCSPVICLHSPSLAFFSANPLYRAILFLHAKRIFASLTKPSVAMRSKFL